MKGSEFAKVAIAAWGVPVVIVLVMRWATPDPSQPRDAFPSRQFTPAKIERIEKKGSKRSDYFELWLHHPDGERFFHRDPEPEPIDSLLRGIPQNTPLDISFRPTREGNTLLHIAPAARGAQPILSFADVMAEYAGRRRLVYIIAAIWFVLGSLFLLALWKVKIVTPPERSDRDVTPE